MIHAYAKEYLNDAMKNLGEAFDYAANVCNLDLDDFMNLFITTQFASYFENGNPKVIAGLSGTELVMEVIEKSNNNLSFKEPLDRYDLSREYWCGWILAYYQWETRRSFKDIHRNISMDEILSLYSTLHEASEDKFVEVLDTIIKRKNTTSRLQKQRKKCGYSQNELSIISGVNLRTLQQYELKTKNINKASVEAVISLANALGCKINDIIEYSSKKTLAD